MERTPSGIQGHTLEVTVVSGCKFKMKKISQMHLYVRIDYASNKYRTETCKGGKKTSFDEKFTIKLIEGVHELYLVVWNSNTLRSDDFIGSGNVKLNKVLTHGFEELIVPLLNTNHQYAGEVKLILHAPHVLKNYFEGNESTPPPQYNNSRPATPIPHDPPTHALHSHRSYHNRCLYPPVDSSYPIVHHTPTPIHYPVFLPTPNYHSEGPIRYPQPHYPKSEFNTGGYSPWYQQR